MLEPIRRTISPSKYAASEQDTLTYLIRDGLTKRP
jgi:hypothetical protein